MITNMSVEEECELQQLVSSDEENAKNGCITPPQSVQPISTINPYPKVPAHHHRTSSEISHKTSKASSTDNNSGQGECNLGSKISRTLNVTSSSNLSNLSTHGSSTAAHGGPNKANTSGHDHKPPRPPQPNLSRLQNKKAMTSLNRPCQHHCFLSDVMDVRQMEQALLHLLEDFHSGKLRAFGKGCSMEQMTAIHEQQERLARLHFELGAQQDLFLPLSDEGLKQGASNMKSLMESLEQLSLSIEKLHSINSNSDSV